MTDPEVLIPARQGRAVRMAHGAAVNGAAQRLADVHFRVHDNG